MAYFKIENKIVRMLDKNYAIKFNIYEHSMGMGNIAKYSDRIYKANTVGLSYI